VLLDGFYAGAFREYVAAKLLNLLGIGYKRFSECTAEDAAVEVAQSLVGQGASLAVERDLMWEQTGGSGKVGLQRESTG
jgi:hypothetical protein